MKLIHKNFFYTTIITSILTVLVLGYFVLMLPSLYVDYMRSENYDAIVAQQRNYLKDGSYHNVTIKNPSCITIDIPFANDSFVVTGKTFQVTIKPTTEAMKELLFDIKSYVKSNVKSLNDSDETRDSDQLRLELKEKTLEWKDALMEELAFIERLPFSFDAQSDFAYYDYGWEESTKFYYLSEETIIIEAGVNDGENNYTNYVGLTFNNDRIVVSVLPTMTPEMDQITPIVIRSLPMLIAVIILFALVVSYLYSRGMVDPILRLVKHTQAVKQRGFMGNTPLTVKGSDEIAILTRTLNHLYEELEKNYKALETKNNELEQKNKSKEVFLRSSSHGLKTPIAAALLLVDGMMNQIGKYKDTKVYLPEVKKQLLSMRKIVEDILYMNRLEESMTFETIDLNVLVERQLSYYLIPIAEGNYDLVTKFSNDCFVVTDANILTKVIDNLISNAIAHSKEGATIQISTKPYELEIFNRNAHINEALLPNIFEPFVSGNEKGKGHGLGLYIVAYYANMLGAKVKIYNVEDGVVVKLTFDQALE